MRKSILLPLLLTACAGGDSRVRYELVQDFTDRASPMVCSPVDLGEVAIEELRSATDSSFLVLDAAQHRLTEFGDDLRPIWSLEYHEHGPGGVDRPISATLVGDSAVAILAQGGLELVVLDRRGASLHTRPLEFVPHKVAAAGDELLITAVPLGSSPGALLFRFRDGALEEVGVPPRSYSDMMTGAIGNRVTVAVLADGGALVMHQFLAPRAFYVAPDRTAVSPVTVPTPDATESRIRYIPRPPITTAQADEMLVPAIAASVDRTRDQVYLLTRSGREVNDRWERAVLRTDGRLRFLAGYTLDVHATHLAVLPRRNALLVSDPVDRVHLCPFPDADTRTE